MQKCIGLNEHTKLRLDSIGEYKDSYDSIINRLIDFYENKLKESV